jgi:hypothetical protein
MLQGEAVVKMLQPGFNVAAIAAKRRNKSNPWFKRGTLFRSAVDVLRRASAPMTARGLPHLDSREGTPGDAQAGYRPKGGYPVALRKRNEGAVVGEGARALATKRGRPNQSLVRT